MHVADHALLSRLLNDHSSALVLYAQQLCDNPEDMVQEAFLRLMQQRPIPENIVGWLYRVVRNEAISASRAAARRTRHELAATGQHEPWFSPANDDTVDAITAVAALQSLPVEQREVIVLRIWGGRTFEEIAALIGKSTSTAHRQYEKGLKSLRDTWSMSCQSQRTDK